MTRIRRFGLISLVLLGMAGSAWIATDASAGDTKVAQGKPPPTAKEAIQLTPEGLNWGLSQAQISEFYNKVLDQDYNPVRKRTSIGPRMNDLEAALKEEQLAFPRSEVTFGTLPVGTDNSPLKGEYNYKNNESMWSLTRKGVTRYFFFWNKRLWKVYDAIPMKAKETTDAGKPDGEGDAPSLGASYKEAIQTLTSRYGVPGRVLAEDPAHGRNATEVDWVDAKTHVRAIDRSGEKILGLVFEERSTSDRMVAIRAQNKGEQGGIDPTITAITKPGQAVDPNASAADAYTGKAHATPPAVPPPSPSGAPPGKKK
jgi:hypothetical protein